MEEPDGVKHLTGKGIWHEYNGRHPHWTEEFVGERYSIVAYRKPQKKSLPIPNDEERRDPQGS